MSGDMSHRERGAGSDSTQSSDPASASVATTADVAAVANVASVAQVAHVAQVAVATGGAGAGSGTGAVGGSDSAERVGKLLDVRDATPAQPLSHMTLNLDNPTGNSDSITIQLRGGAVDTSISLGDAGRADKMSLRVGELQHALEQQGLESASIRVASTAADTGAGWSPRQGSDGSPQQGRSALNYRDSRQDADDTRQRARKEQQGRQK